MCFTFNGNDWLSIIYIMISLTNSAYIQVYLALKLERKHGKKVYFDNLDPHIKR